ncbi:MAG: terpene cyclase/mutase family protein, partial [Verrucomicrobiales bacterium]|nr:terpene cyclase/mutase family protein [Verrucomicrobiales bacterium]
AGSDSAVESETGSESVASGSLVAEATQAESQLTESGGASQEATQTPELASGKLPLYAISAPLLPDSLESDRKVLNGGGLTDLIKKHRGKPSLDTIKQMGGSDGTEKAIVAGIEWLSKNQEKDGRWDTKKFNAEANYDVGGTGLALLCYFGWGARHDRPGKYQNNVKKALSWLIKQQNKDGNLAVSGKMYSHAIGTIALCEGYGITKDSEIKIAAQKAIGYTISSQHPQLGGWRYRPGQESDTSVTGWQFMALHSARMAGINVSEQPFELARRWLDFAGGGKHGGLYGYKGPSEISRAMVATGMFCRQLDLIPPTDPRMIESAQLLKNNPLRPINPDLYYIYYATLALYQHQGPIWQDWNNKLKETLPKIQNKTGKNAGSWDLSRLMTKGGGRVASTTLAVLSLEVYYRILPMYGFRGTDVPEIKLKEGQ